MKKILCLISILMVTFSVIGCSSFDVDSSKEQATSKDEKQVVVATSVAITEILDRLGVEVSGVPQTSYELPESAKGATEVGSPMNPDMEIIKSLNPTDVICVDTLGSDFEKQFEENNINADFYNLSNVDGLKETIAALGEKFNKQDKANEILDEIIKLNPDKILVMTHAVPEAAKKSVEEELSKDLWKNVNAVKNNDITYLENGYFGMSANLQIVEAVEKLGDILYE